MYVNTIATMTMIMTVIMMLSLKFLELLVVGVVVHVVLATGVVAGITINNIL